jgi:gliding motility-associated-like protein
MCHLKGYLLLFCLFFLFTFSAKGQYTLRGSATQDNCNCYTLTKTENNQAGSVFNNQQYDLTKPFDFWFNVYLGCSDFGGADGIVFMLQANNTSVGRNGSGMGFADVAPSIGIALDTYQNTVIGDNYNDLNDPAYDHISIQVNGVVRHGTDLAGPVQASASSDNIEDCAWHTLRISWDPASQFLRTYFDGVLRLETQTDLVKDIFRNNPVVYWGFSAATGGLNNLQKFCTALNPDFTTNLTNDAACIGSTVSFINQSVSFAPIASYYWDLGDGTITTTANIQNHLYQQPGNYEVKLALKGLDGCTSDTLKKIITIASKPHADFSISDACFGDNPRIITQSTNTGVSTQWFANGSEVVTENGLPILNTLEAGSYTLRTTVTSDYGCGVDEASKNFMVKAVPVVTTGITNVCVNSPVQFYAQQVNANTEIKQWRWRFGDGAQSNLQNPIYTYTKGGNYNTQLWAVAENGCSSDTVTNSITVIQAFAFAGNDTIVLNNVPFTLQGSGEGSIKWSPSTGLSRDDILAPTGLLTNDQVYELQVTTPEGCIAKDTVRIEVFKGSVIYVPTAFTPNGNGLNDQLLPRYVGIKKLNYFTIYNRWGQVVFNTTDTRKGWDGTLNGKAVATGAYVWMLHAEDIASKVYRMKGTFTLIR